MISINFFIIFVIFLVFIPKSGNCLSGVAGLGALIRTWRAPHTGLYPGTRNKALTGQVFIRRKQETVTSLVPVSINCGHRISMSHLGRCQMGGQGDSGLERDDPGKINHVSRTYEDVRRAPSPGESGHKATERIPWPGGQCCVAAAEGACGEVKGVDSEKQLICLEGLYPKNEGECVERF